MYIIKEGFDKQEKREIENVLSEIPDLYGDFYSTQNNIRISLRDNSDILLKYLRKGSQFVYEQGNDKGIALVLKEKGFRTYVKILTRDEKLANNLLKLITWHTYSDLYAKIHKNNPLIKVFNRNGYIFKGDRGSEILLYKKYIPRPKKEYKKFKGDTDDNQYQR